MEGGAQQRKSRRSASLSLVWDACTGKSTRLHREGKSMASPTCSDGPRRYSISRDVAQVTSPGPHRHARRPNDYIDDKQFSYLSHPLKTVASEGTKQTSLRFASSTQGLLGLVQLTHYPRSTPTFLTWGSSREQRGPSSTARGASRIQR